MGWVTVRVVPPETQMSDLELCEKATKSLLMVVHVLGREQFNVSWIEIPGAGRMASRMDVGTRNSFFAACLTPGGRFAYFFPVVIQSAFT